MYVRAMKNAEHCCASFLVLSQKHRQFWMNLFHPGIMMYLALSRGWAQTCCAEHTRTNFSWSRWCRRDKHSKGRPCMKSTWAHFSLLAVDLKLLRLPGLTFCLFYVSLSTLVDVWLLSPCIATYWILVAMLQEILLIQTASRLWNCTTSHEWSPENTKKASVHLQLDQNCHYFFFN